MSKHLKIIIFIIFLILGVYLGGCAQPGSKQQIGQDTPALTVTAPTANPDLSSTATAVSKSTETHKQPVVEITPALQPAIPIGLENAAKLESVKVISLPNATDFRWCDNGQSLCVTLPGEVVVYNLGANLIGNRIAASNPKLLSIAPSEDVLAWVENDSQIRIWDLQLSTDQAVDTQAESIIDLIFDSTGSRLVASTGNQSIQSWDLMGDEVNLQFDYSGWLVDLDFSPDNKQLAGVSQDEFAAIIFEAASGNEEHRLTWIDHASPVLYGGLFSPDWETLAWVTRGTIQLMDVQSEELGPILGHEDFIVATAWSPNSDLIAAAAAGTVGGDYKPLITLWDPISGHFVAGLAHDAPLLQIAFSPDGSQLASLDTDGNINIWIVSED